MPVWYFSAVLVAGGAAMAKHGAMASLDDPCLPVVR
jgi:hypothetical protein